MSSETTEGWACSADGFRALKHGCSECKPVSESQQPCIRQDLVSFQGLRVGGALSLSLARKVNVEPGCHVPDPCSSSPCPANSYCDDLWDGHSCTCLSGQCAPSQLQPLCSTSQHLLLLCPSPGYFGTNCTDVCSLNPCEHEAACSRKPGSPRGYKCDCPRNYFGQYCEKKYGVRRAAQSSSVHRKTKLLLLQD